jgi:hypothetical protein
MQVSISKTVCAVALVVLLTTVRLSAHHAFTAEYDEKKRVTVAGTVTTFKWTNPHVWVYLDSRDERGKIARWRFELGSTVGLTARGWKKTDLKAGDPVTLEGFGAKNGKNVANLTWVVLTDGRKLFGGFETTPGAPPKPGATVK